jgi:ABC-type transporter MlaC component
MKHAKAGGGRWGSRAGSAAAAAILVVGAGAWLAPAAACAKGEVDPLAKLRHTDAEIRAAVNQRVPDWSPEAPARQMRIDRLLRSLLDYDGIARRALGASYTTLPPARRRAFVAAFSAVTGQTFLAKIEDTERRTVYDSESIEGGEARVTGRECPRGAPGETDVQVVYVLERHDSDWLVTDVVIDGTSLVASYKQQLRPLVAREGIDGLMLRMRNQLSTSRN